MLNLDQLLSVNDKPNPFLSYNRYPVANSTDGIRSKVGYESGVHLFEIFWPQGQRGTNAVIGVCTSDAPLYGNSNYHDLVGSNPSTWGWDVTRGKVYHNKMGAVYPSGRVDQVHWFFNLTANAVPSRGLIDSDCNERLV